MAPPFGMLPNTAAVDVSAGGLLNEPLLSRNVRSHHNIGIGSKESLLLSQLMSNHTPLNSYKEHTDTNPELCYGVAGLSNGQRKLCAQHTHMMPAVSRGARAALQVSCTTNMNLHNMMTTQTATLKTGSHHFGATTNFLGLSHGMGPQSNVDDRSSLQSLSV